MERVKELVDRGEPLNARDQNGRTPLMHAVLLREVEVARLLLERDANPNLADNEGDFPLHASLRWADRALAELMLDHCARPDLPNNKGITPLHMAAGAGAAPLVTRLMNQLAPLDAQDRKGATPLHMAALNNRPAATRALLRGGPDLEIRLGDGRTALHVAVQERAHGIIELLMAAGADPTAYGRFGETPLSLAYANKDWEAVELMEGPGTCARIQEGLAAATEHRIPEAYCQGLERNLELLRQSIGPITNTPRFNANRFLEVFDRVRIKEGYVLDYYHQSLDNPPPPGAPRLFAMDAQPYVFTRPMNQPHDEAAGIAAGLYWRRPHLMEHLEFERSPEGLLQWVMFRTAANQFHRVWQGNYSDTRYILTLAGLERVLADLPPARPDEEHLVPRPCGPRGFLDRHGTPFLEYDRERLRALDLTPWTRVAGDLGEVRVLTFTRGSGFAWRHLHLRWPHHVDREDQAPVVEYDNEQS